MIWAEFITRHDGPNTLFYLDPPYWGCEGDYGKDLLGRDEFARIADQLGKIKGRFLMSINDVPEIREIFEAFQVTEITTAIPSGRRTTAGGDGRS